MEDLQQSKKEQLFFLWQKNRLFILVTGSIIVLFVVTLSIILLLQRIHAGTLSKNNAVPIFIQQHTQDIYFDTYKDTASLPTLPPSVNIYTLKNNFTSAEIALFAAKFGIQSIIQPVNSNNENYTAVDKTTKSLFSFDAHTGVLSYQSAGFIKLNGSAQGINYQVTSMLEQIGLADSTVACPITYQRRSVSGITFVECHRDWMKIGLPIYNFEGLLNVPQSTPLSSLAIGQVDTINFPNDFDIVNLTGVFGNTGKARPNEFNTATVGIRSDGTVVSIMSNLRWISGTETVSSPANLLTPKGALQQFIDHKAPLSLTQPLGSGSVDIQKVYQNNNAIAKEATITDYVLSYLEKLPGETQQYLVPMYTIRGTATLTTGYRVSFVQTVPALQDGRTFTSRAVPLERKQEFLTSLFTSIKNFFRPYSYAQTQTLQLKTFNPLESTSPVPSALSSPTQPGGSSTKCFDYSSLTFADPSKSHNFQHGVTKLSESTFSIPGSGTLKLAYDLAVALGAAGGFGSDEVFYELSSFPLSIPQAADTFFGLITNQYTVNVARHLVTDQSGALNASSSLTDVKNLFAAINGGQCPATPPLANSAPEYNCSASGPGGFHGSLDTARMNSVADAAAQQVLDAVKTNSINTLASQPDIYSGGLMKVFTIIDTTSWNKNPILAPLAPCYLSGGPTVVEGASPSLFIYSPYKQNVSITLPSFTTYTDPITTNGNSWNVVAIPDGTLLDNSKAIDKNLYYEYASNKVAFSQPKNGFVVPFNQWEKTIRGTIAKGLGLTQQETDRLVIEVQNAVYGKIKSPYLILSLIPQDEVNKKLPLTISPQPDNFYRIEILITGVGKNLSLSEQIIPLLRRTGLTAVELGARME